MAGLMQLISSAVLHVHAYILRFLSYLSPTPALPDSASLDALERGRPPSILDISRDPEQSHPPRHKSHSISHVPPPEPSLHQRKRSSTVWFKKPAEYDDVVARVRRAIEACAEEEDVRAVFDRRSAWGTIREDSASTYSCGSEAQADSELAYANQDSAMVSSVSTFVAGFPTYKSLDKVLAGLALQSTVSWSDLVLFSEDTLGSDLLSLEE